MGIIKQSTLIWINVSFILDILFTLHTGYYETGKIIMDRKKIAMRYLKGTFITDILAQIPLFWAYTVDQNSEQRSIVIAYILEFLIFFKTFNLISTFQRLERVITDTQIGSSLWPLFQLIVKVIILAHLIGSGLFGMAMIEKEYKNESNTWIDRLEIADQDWFHQYLYSVYWAFSTMVSNVVYQPVTKSELIYTLVMMILMTGIFGYVINTIGLVLTDLEKKTKQFKLERERTNRFMKKKQIPEKLRERVYLYLEYLQSQETNRNQEEEDLVLSRLSDQLRREILREVNQKNLNLFKMIKENFSEFTNNETLLVIKEQMFSQGDIIYESYKSGNEEIHQGQMSLYVVMKGVVEIFYERQDVQSAPVMVGQVKEGQIFGHLEFFTGQCRVNGARATEACSVIEVRRSDFLEILQKGPKEDYEKFCVIRDQLFQYNTSIYNVFNCSFCNESGHQPHHCPKSHMIVDVKQLIYDYNNYDLQLYRTQWDREPSKLHHARLHFTDIREAVIDVHHSPDLQELLQHLQVITNAGHYQQGEENQEDNIMNNMERKLSLELQDDSYGQEYLNGNMGYQQDYLDQINEEEDNNDESKRGSQVLSISQRNKKKQRSIIVNQNQSKDLISQSLQTPPQMIDRMGGRKRSAIRLDKERKQSVTYTMNNYEQFLLQEIANLEQYEKKQMTNHELQNNFNKFNNMLNSNPLVKRQFKNPLDLSHQTSKSQIIEAGTPGHRKLCMEFSNQSQRTPSYRNKNSSSNSPNLPLNFQDFIQNSEDYQSTIYQMRKNTNTKIANMSKLNQNNQINAFLNISHEKNTPRKRQTSSYTRERQNSRMTNSRISQSKRFSLETENQNTGGGPGGSSTHINNQNKVNFNIPSNHENPIDRQKGNYINGGGGSGNNNHNRRNSLAEFKRHGNGNRHMDESFTTSTFHYQFSEYQQQNNKYSSDKDFQMLPNFDKMHNYTVYWPVHNISTIRKLEQFKVYFKDTQENITEKSHDSEREDFFKNRIVQKKSTLFQGGTGIVNSGIPVYLEMGLDKKNTFQSKSSRDSEKSSEVQSPRRYMRGSVRNPAMMTRYNSNNAKSFQQAAAHSQSRFNQQQQQQQQQQQPLQYLHIGMSIAGELEKSITPSMTEYIQGTPSHSPTDLMIHQQYQQQQQHQQQSKVSMQNSINNSISNMNIHTSKHIRSKQNSQIFTRNPKITINEKTMIITEEQKQKGNEQISVDQ